MTLDSPESAMNMDAITMLTRYSLHEKKMGMGKMGNHQTTVECLLASYSVFYL
jgi:hypothetical protein